jgi:copper chaperone CopZ
MPANLNRKRLQIALLAISVFLSPIAFAEDKPAEPAPVKYRVTGLFSTDRQADLREVMQELPEVALVSIDFKTSEASFRFEAAKAFPGAKPEQIVERFDNRLRTVSRSTFGIQALCTIPRDKLKFIEIPVIGLDCKGCCLGAYEAINKLDGVEQATASFKDGLVTAWIDPKRTDQPALEDALKKRNVQLGQPQATGK